MGSGGCVNLALRLMCVVPLGLHLAGCAAIAASAAIGALEWAGVELGVAVAMSPVVAIPQAVEQKHCQGPSDRGVAVTEVESRAAPAEAVGPQVYGLATWRPAWEREGRVEIEPNSEPLDGTVTITDIAVLFVPAQGTGFRIPHELILGVDAVESPVSMLVIRSCGRRLDVLTFWDVPRKSVAPKTAADAAASIRSRLGVTAART
jgi:hypothetical protein